MQMMDDYNDDDSVTSVDLFHHLLYLHWEDLDPPGIYLEYLFLYWTFCSYTMDAFVLIAKWMTWCY